VSSRRALAYSFVDRYAGLLLSIVASMIIARLLTPAEIGVFSVAMVLLSFLGAMRDFGAGQYLVQEKELTTERVRAIWTVQLGLGVAFAGIVLVAAVPVARFYAEPRMRDIMFLLSLNFAVSPFGSLTYAWLMREMRFDSLAMMRFAGSLTGACVSVGMAWRGWGPISLAAGSLAATLANALVATIFRPKSFPWLPGITGLGRVVSFGGRLSLMSVLTTSGNSVPDLVLGKLHGMVSVGLYSRANGLAGMFQRLMLDATQAVAMPLLAKASREGSSPVPIFMMATSYVTAIGWSFFGAMIVLAHPVVRVLYGTQWDAAVPLTRLVAAAAAIGLPSAFCSVALLASGTIALLMRITLMTVVQTAVILAAGAALGLLPLGWAIVLAAAVSTGIWTLLSPVVREVARVEFLKMLLRSACVAAVAVTAVVASTSLLTLKGDEAIVHLVQLAVGVLSAALAFASALFVFKHPLREEIVRMVALLRKRR
jgi:O-antigen/teichoic acid export membrane protein